MKNSAFALMLLAAGLLSFSIASAGSPACADTDGGWNYFVKGTVTDPSGSYTDFCESSRFLTEFYCVSQADPGNSNSDYMNQLARDCEWDGGRCSDGICVHGTTTSSTTTTSTTTSSTTTTTTPPTTTTTLPDSTTTTTISNSTTTTTIPPEPPQQNPVGTSNPCCGGSGISGYAIPLKEELYLMNPPSTIFGTAGNTTEFELALSNAGNRKSKISFNFSGAPAEWFSILPKESNLSAGESTTYKIKFAPQEAGNYNVNFSVEGTETTISFPMKLVVEEQKIETTTTTNIPATTTTIPPSGGITGAILFASNNPAVVGGLALASLIGGSIWWSMRKPKIKIQPKEEPTENGSSETPAPAAPA